MTIPDKNPFYIRLCANLLIVGLLIALLYIGQEILVPIFFSILLASLLLPVNRYMERMGLHRIIAITISLVISLFVISFIVYFLVHQIINFLDDLPTIQDRLGDLALTVQKWIRESFGITIKSQNQYLNETGLKNPGAGILQQTFVTVTSVLSYVVLLPVYTFLILFYRGRIKEFFINVFKNSSKEEVKEILQESQAMSQGYITGLMIELTIVFSLNALGFLIIGIKYALFLALVAALLNLIPYIGMIVASIFSMLLTLICCDVVSYGDVLWVAVVLAVVQFIDNNFLMPLIVGSKVRINALANIFGVLIGGAICGVPGMFLSIPALALLKVIFDRADGLKPLGTLMGDETRSLKPKRTPIKKSE